MTISWGMECVVISRIHNKSASKDCVLICILLFIYIQVKSNTNSKQTIRKQMIKQDKNTYHKVHILYKVNVSGNTRKRLSGSPRGSMYSNSDGHVIDHRSHTRPTNTAAAQFELTPPASCMAIRAVLALSLMILCGFHQRQCVK